MPTLPLYQKHRPQTWDAVVGQDKPVARLREKAPDGFSGQAYWISGKSGTGKSTIARLLAREVADPFNILELDGSDLTLTELDRIRKHQHLAGLGSKHGRAYVVNESHGIERRQIITRLLVMLEAIPPHVAWCFTTTVEGLSLFEGHVDAHPLLSRCVLVSLRQRGLVRPFALEAQRIARLEGLDGRPLEDHEERVRQQRCNLRSVLQEVQSGRMAQD